MTTAQAKSAPYQPNKRTIGELLSTTNPPIVVPDWQRSYSWTLAHVEAFWNDLLYFIERHTQASIKTAEYFVGSIVIVAATTDQHLLLDGQQRLATSAILLSVIRDYLARYSKDASTRTQSRYLADFDDAANKTVFKIRLNEYDKDFFQRRILEEQTGTTSTSEPTHASHHLILATKAFFSDKFEGKYNELKNQKQAHDWALQIQDALVHHVSLVAISSTDEDSASEVFETLNDRGIGLSTPDLLRNFVMRRATAESRQEVVALWSDVFEFESDTEIKSFLRHFWTSHYGDVKTQRLYREIRDHITNDGTDSLKFSRDLNDASKIYRRILDASDDADDTFDTILKDMKELGVTALFPLTLAAIQSIGPEDRNQLLARAINVYVRHSVIGQLEGSKIESLFLRTAASLRQKKTLDEIQIELMKFAPSSEDFVKAFARISVGRTATQRYLLRKFELFHRSTEELVLNTNKKVHVEHIYPQKPADADKWSGHNTWINRLGNLTLFDGPMNSAVKNGKFLAKRPFYEKSDIVITRQLVGLSEWSEDAVSERQDKLAQSAPEVWPTG